MTKRALQILSGNIVFRNRQQPKHTRCFRSNYRPVVTVHGFTRTPIDPLLTIHKSALTSIFLHFVHGRYRTARWSNGTVHLILWSISIGPVQPRKVVHLERGTDFFENFSGWAEPIHSVLDRNFRKFWLNGSHPWPRVIQAQCSI